MVGRIAWIACLGVTLLCFIEGKFDLTSSSRPQQDPLSRACELHQSFTGLNPCLEETQSRGDLKPSSESIVVLDDPGAKSPAGLRRPNLAAAEPNRHLNPVFGPSQLESIRQVVFNSEESGSDDAEEPAKKFWSKPKVLLGQIKKLQQLPLTQRWSTETLAILESIAKASPDSEHLPQRLRQLEEQVQCLPQLVQSIRLQRSNPVEEVWRQSEISRAAYRLGRRLAVWKAIQRSIGCSKSTDKSNLIQNASFNRISFSDLDPRWIDYLKLKEYHDAFECLRPDPESQKNVARSMLARIDSPVLNPQQSAYIHEVIDPELIKVLKKHASDPVDPSELISRIEGYEGRCSSLTGYYLNDQFQSLMWSDDPNDLAIASEIQTHYRNANFRLAVSEDLLNRLIPALPETAQPVSEHVQGARVTGQSHISSRLRVNLVPDPDRIMFQLANQGNVHSNTIAKTNAFRIQNKGQAQFQVAKRISIGRDGIDSSERPRALSSANQFVVGVQSKVDNIPVVGWMARRLAVKKMREQAPETDRIFEQKVANSAESLMQNEVDEQLSKLQQYATVNLFQPLSAMDLEPVPVQLATTEQQVIMRYRLAGRDQMAANTARPRDSETSLMSLQIHQSAVNNMIARIGLNGNLFTIEELDRHLREVVGAPQLDATDSPSEQHAEIRFAHFDPIRLDFREDRLNVTLNLKSLKLGESGKQWKNISLTASYKLNASGLTINLQQDDDGTRIKGKRLRFGDKAAISTIMKVLFKQEYAINVPANFRKRIGGPAVEFSQLVVSDGWIAVSVDDHRKANRSPLDDKARVGAIRRRINNRR